MTNPVYKKQINKVVNFILKNLNDELTLQKLAGIANYSPFHFQKIFKQVIGESPKQYIIRMRLENAAHSLFVYRHKSITEIALDSGFASNATFARAFKNYFGFSAEAFRELSPKEKMNPGQYERSKKNKTKTDTDFINNIYDVGYWSENLKVTVKRSPSIRTIFMNAPLSDTVIIQEMFKKISQLADTHDLLTTETKFIGLINPHQGLYRTAVTISAHHKSSNDISTIEIEAGKFATYKIKGNSLQTFHSLHAFYELWLPNSGYNISDSTGFEILAQNPASAAYEEIEREIYIAIEPE